MGLALREKNQGEEPQGSLCWCPRNQTQAGRESRNQPEKRNPDLGQPGDRFKSLVVNLPGLVYQCKNDRNRTMEFVSDGCRELTEYFPGDFTSGKVNFGPDVIHPEDQNKVSTAIQEALKQFKPFTLSYRILTRSGKIKHVWERGRGLFDDKRSLKSLEGIILDVSEQEQYRLALKESESRFFQLVNNINDVFWIADENFKAIYVSPKFEGIWGRTLKHSNNISRCWSESILPSDRERLKEIFKLDNVRKNGFDVEYRIQKPDGTIRWIRDRAFPIATADGTISRVAGIAQDITDLKLSKEALSRSKILFETLSRISPVGIFLSKDNGYCEYINPQFSKFTDLDLETINEKGWTSAVYEEDRLAVSELWETALKSKTPFSREFRFIKLDGTLVWVLGQIVPEKTREGGFRGFVGSFTDISVQKEAEIQLQHERNKLQRLYRHIEDVREEERLRIARELHDEMGNILNQIRLELTKLRDNSSSNNASKEKLDQILQALKEAYNNVQRTIRELRPVVLDTFGLTEAFSWYVEKFAKKFSIDIDLSILPDNISVDNNRKIILFRILQESLTNIARHSQAKRALVILRQKKKNIILLIKDDGVGIQKNKIEDMNSFGIMGMSERVQGLGGSFVIKGVPGKGTLITIKLPL